MATANIFPHKKISKNSYFKTLLCTILFSLSFSAQAEEQEHPFYIERARVITLVFKLSEKPLQCINFEILEKPFEGKAIVEAREIHNDNCGGGGDANTSPRFFHIGFEPTSDAVWTDAKSADGQLEKLGENRTEH